MSAKEKVAVSSPVNSPAFAIRSISITLRGINKSPLVVHSFSEKAKQQIRDKQQKKAKGAKLERNPYEEFLAARCLYTDPGHSTVYECVPITAIKKSFISAATAFDDLTKVSLRQAIFVDSELIPGAPVVPIELYDGSLATAAWDPIQCEDAVTIGINTRGLVYRPKYPEWQLRIRIEYNPRLISEEQLLALVTQAGWGVGICEGRPERSSALSWGRFERYVKKAP